MEGFEFYQGIYKEKEGITLRANGAGASFSFCLDKKEGKRYRLFTAGGTELFKWWKSEYGYPTLYTTIHDALDCVHAKKARYCLNLSCKRAEEDIKRAYKKVLWKPQYYYIDIHNLPTEWKVGIFAKAKKLKIEKDGYLRMKIELRYNKEGVGRRSVAERADVTETIDFPEGTYEYTEFCKELTIPPEAASVAILLEGVRYSGEFYVERPYLRGDDIDLLPDFGESEPNKTEFDWCGLHLSRKERPEFEVRLNGKVVFRGEIFERSHCGSEWEIPLPSKLLKKSNTIAYKLISDYRDPLPYTICESAILEQPCGAFCVIAVQQNAGVGGKARVLLRTEKENVLVRFSCESGALKGEEKYLLKEKGLHGIALDCVKPCLNAKFTLEANGTAYPLEIARIAQKTSDGVVTGTGDLIYVHQDEESFEEFLCWYLSNGVGDFVTVRPAYRWSGTRKINLEVWKTFVRVVNELQMNYAHMIDGRDAPGINVNPSFDELDGEGFLGRQDHEVASLWYNCGGAVGSAFADMQADMKGFVYDDDPKHTGEGYSNALRVYDGDAVWSRWNFGGVKDYQEAHDKSIAYIKKRKIEPRVTDPSYQLKYLREAGYRWFGAETMYTSMEAQTGVLRGVCKDADVKAFGTHNPVQWASSPHDSPECNRRYRLALYLSYMLGASVINTEEGLWRLEEYFVDFNRFSDACKLHLKEQQDLAKYISTHTRSGEFYTPLAVVHGRLDGYNSITGKIWGIAYETEADRSWGVLEEFYPHYKTHCIYRHGCSTSEPQGWFTGTPYGCADILPIEGKPSTLAGYKTYIFTGYNKAEKSDFDKLFEQVEKGGVVLMTLAHFTITTEAERVRNYDLQFDETAERFTCGAPVFVTGHYRGQEIAVCENVKTENAVVAERTDEGLPLVVRYTVGNGEIVLFNAKAYPAHIAIKELYKTYMRNVALAATAQERVWAQGDERTDFAFYKQQNGDVHAYFTAVDWYHAPETPRSATLRIGKDRYEIRFPFGRLLKVVIASIGAFAYSLEESGEVIAVNDGSITVQGEGKGRFVYGKNGIVRETEIDFETAPVQEIKTVF